MEQKKKKLRLRIAVLCAGLIVLLMIALLICERLNMSFVSPIVSLFDYAAYPAVITLKNPSAVHITENDDILIVDNRGRRLLKAALDGTYDLQILSNKKTFHEATNIVLDKQGIITVNDTHFGLGKMSVLSESIMRQNIVANEQQTVLTKNNLHQNAMETRRSFFGPFIADNSIYIIQAGDYTIDLINISKTPSVPNNLIFSIPYDQPNLFISSFATDGRSVWFVHKKGIIYKTTGSQPEIIYDGTAESHNISLPWELAYNSNLQELYWTDLGQRAVYKIDYSGKRELVFSSFEISNQAFGNLPILYTLSVNAKGTIASIADNKVLVKNNNGILYLNERFILKKSLLIKKLITLTVLFITIGYVAIIFLWILFRVLALIMRTLFGKLAVSIVIVIIVSLSLVLNITQKNTTEINQERIYALLSSLVHSGGRIIDSHALTQIQKPADYMNENYNILKESIHRLIDSKADWAAGLYCILYRYENNILYAVLFLNDSTGAYFPYDTIGNRNLDTILERGEIIKNMQIDKSELWLNVQGPIYNEDNVISGILEVGVETKTAQQFYKTADTAIIIAALSVGLFIQLFVMFTIKLTSKRKHLFEKK